MRSRSLALAVATVALVCAAIPAWAARRASAPPATGGPAAYIVMDADSGTVLAEHEAHKRWPPASMTKMMTVLIAMERVRDHQLSLDEPVRASAWASRIGGSQVYLAEGESFPLGEMLKAIMIASANDAAVAVAEHIAGSTTAFVDLMNERAKALGLADTTYQSVHGLPPGPGQTADLTSAHDLAILGRELMRFPEVMRWAGTPTAGFRNDTLQMSNTNHLVRTYPGATGLKTGYYREAGFCVTATATRNDMNLVAVVLGLEMKNASFSEAARLLNEGRRPPRAREAGRGQGRGGRGPHPAPPPGADPPAPGARRRRDPPRRPGARPRRGGRGPRRRRDGLALVALEPGAVDFDDALGVLDGDGLVGVDDHVVGEHHHRLARIEIHVDELPAQVLDLIADRALEHSR
jgi:D-alanyl-D-alanine carboxypeptidase (penicillin-binding protein 5/6)